MSLANDIPVASRSGLIPSRLLRLIGLGTSAPRARAALSLQAQANLLYALCRMANAAGAPDDDAVTSMTANFAGATGVTVADDDIRAALASPDATLAPAQFGRYAAGINGQERRALFRAIMALATSGGEIGPAQHALLGEMAAALDIGAAETRAMLRDLAISRGRGGSI